MKTTNSLAGLRIGIIGKGGSGKSTVTVLLARALSRRGYDVYVLDADSTNVGMHLALGLDEAPLPLLDYFGGSVFSGGAVTCPVDDPTLLDNATVAERDLGERYIRRTSEGIRLLAAGKMAEMGAGAGCDGPVAKITRDLRIIGDAPFPITLIDFKAGFEDSARGVIVGLDAIVVVVDPTTAALRMASAMKRMVDAIRNGGLPATQHLHDPVLIELANSLFRESSIRSVYVVLNRVADDEAEHYLSDILAREKITPSGVIHEDRRLARAWMRGEALGGTRVEEEAERIVTRIEAAETVTNGRDRAVSSTPV